MPPARDRATRIADTRRRLAHDLDAWVSTAGPDGPWLAPLSFAWHEGALLFATEGDSPTGRNLAQRTQVRIGIGETRDVVMVHGEAEPVPFDDLTADELGALVAKFDSDPRAWATIAIRVRPVAVHAWREENELKGRTIMREGRWLA